MMLARVTRISYLTEVNPSVDQYINIALGCFWFVVVARYLPDLPNIGLVVYDKYHIKPIAVG